MLADGFTDLGNLAAGEDLHYAFDVTVTPTSTTVTPEPSPVGLVGFAGLAGLAALLVRPRIRQRVATVR